MILVWSRFKYYLIGIDIIQMIFIMKFYQTFDISTYYKKTVYMTICGRFCCEVLMELMDNILWHLMLINTFILKIVYS